MSLFDESAAPLEALRRLIDAPVQPVSRRRNTPAGSAISATTVVSGVGGPGGGASVLSARKLVDDDADDRVVVGDSGDVTWYKDDGSTAFMLWDESDDQLELSVNLDLGGNVLENLTGIAPGSGNSLTLQDDDGDNRIVIETNGDITFYKDDGSTTSLVWDESDDRWEFATDVTVTGEVIVIAAEPVRLYGSDGNNQFIYFYHDGTNHSASIGHPTGSSDDFTFRSIRGDLSIQAEDSEDNSGANIEFLADNTSGTPKRRLWLRGTDGDIYMYKADGSSRIFLWDESQDRLEFSTDVVIDSGALSVDQGSATGAAPVVTLEQADVDEDFFKFIGTSDTNVDRALVDAADFTTPGSIQGWLKVNVQDDQGTNPITDGDYYIPFYSAPSA